MLGKTTQLLDDMPGFWERGDYKGKEDADRLDRLRGICYSATPVTSLASQLCLIASSLGDAHR